jgi:lipopolysaccharide export system permease protein
MPGIIDRYVLWMFFKVLAITFVSLTGLYIVIDAFANLEEFIGHGQKEGGLFHVLCDYYGPRALQFFDRMGPIVVLLAAIFAVTTLLRTNELTAIMAGGVSKGRVLKPLLYASVAVSLLAVVNRECWIPRVRNNLTRNAQDWQGDRQKTLRPTYDYRTDVFIGGRQTVARERKILAAHFRLPASMNEFGTQLTAACAYYKPREADHPPGYLLEQVSVPADVASRKSVLFEGEPIILTQRDAPWLGPQQCFVVSDVSFEQLAGGSYWRQLASTSELMTHLRNPSLDLGNDARVMLHARMVQPLLDLTLLVLGLPVVLAQNNRNMFVAAGMSLGVMVGFFIVVMTCHALGGSYFLSPALSAWLPLMIFSPAAYVTAMPLWR